VEELKRNFVRCATIKVSVPLRLVLVMYTARALAITCALVLVPLTLKSVVNSAATSEFFLPVRLFALVAPNRAGI